MTLEELTFETQDNLQVVFLDHEYGDSALLKRCFDFFQEAYQLELQEVSEVSRLGRLELARRFQESQSNPKLSPQDLKNLIVVSYCFDMDENDYAAERCMLSIYPADFNMQLSISLRLIKTLEEGVRSLSFITHDASATRICLVAPYGDKTVDYVVDFLRPL